MVFLLLPLQHRPASFILPVSYGYTTAKEIEREFFSACLAKNRGVIWLTSSRGQYGYSAHCVTSRLKGLGGIPAAFFRRIQSIQQHQIVAPGQLCNSLLHKFHIRQRLGKGAHVLEVAWRKPPSYLERRRANHAPAIRSPSRSTLGPLQPNSLTPTHRGSSATTAKMPSSRFLRAIYTSPARIFHPSA